MTQNPDPKRAEGANAARETSRRRWLKRGAFGLFAAGLAGGIGFKAFAHRGRFGSEPLDPAELDARIERMLKHLYVEIEATDAQKQQLEPIIKQAAQDLLPLREQMRTARRQALALFSADSIDRAALERLRVEQIQLADAGSKRLVEALADAAEVLKPEQRVALAERFEHRRRRWH
ncbi:MAG: Spy/CpxP family protein refolding chaperone [Betaproteobacteria bacterium]|nr:Spy/CpxP family protein refolding chaperone [Betaproteobacteria bacterium]